MGSDSEYQQCYLTLAQLSSSFFFFDSEKRLISTMKQSTIYYVAFQIAFNSIRLFAFDWELINQYGNPVF